MYPPPRLVYWEITKRCNLRCAHCRAAPKAWAVPDELSLSEGLSLIETIAEVGSPILVFTGGEPLLRGDLFVLARHATGKGLPIALATNGTLVTRAVARRVAGAGFQRVSISLDGPDAETHDDFRRIRGAFDKAVDGFIHLKELGVSMQVNTTVTVHNRNRLDEIRELVRKLGADAWHLFLLVPVGCGLEIAATAQLTPREYEEALCWIDSIAQGEAMEVRATCAPHIQRIRVQRQAMQGVEGQRGREDSSSSTPISRYPPYPARLRRADPSRVLGRDRDLLHLVSRRGVPVWLPAGQGRRCSPAVFCSDLGALTGLQQSQEPGSLGGQMRRVRVSDGLRRVPGPCLWTDRALPRRGAVLQLLPLF